MFRVQQLMSQNVRCCRPEDSLQTAARLLWECDIGALPVVDAEQRVVAMLTDRDICMGAYTQGRLLAEIRVSEVMSRVIRTVHPEQSIDDAMLVMREQQVRRIPVTDGDGRLVGILSQNDLIEEAAREREGQRKELSAPSVMATLAGIGRSRAGELSVVAA